MDVPIEQLSEVTHRLVAEGLAPGTPFGFDHEGKGHVWVVAEQGIDLAAEVQAVLAALS